MTRNFRSLAVAAIVLSAGCSAVVDPEKNDPLLTAEGFCNSVQDVFNDMQCNVIYSYGGALMAPEASEAFFLSIRSACDRLASAVDEGRYAYDGSKAQGCLDAIEARGCKGALSGGTFAWPTECAGAIRGVRNPGDSCFSMIDSAVSQRGTGVVLNECAQGSRCLYTDYNACPGTCGFDSIAGEPCGLGNRYCRTDQNLFCDYGEMKCRTYGSLNDPCSTTVAYRYCDSNWYQCSPTTQTCVYQPAAGSLCSNTWPYCRSGNYCNGSAGTGTCVARQYPPNACSSSYQCVEGSFCAADGKCHWYQTSEGASCASPEQCGYNGSQWLYCDAAQTCRLAPRDPLPRGADCLNLGSSYCGLGLYCAYPSYTCEPQVTTGDCSSSMEMCAPGTTCAYDSAAMQSSCVPLRKAGQSCDTTGSPLACLFGLYCDGTYPNPGTCRVLPGEGQQCLTGGMAYCAPGLRPYWPPTGPCVCRGMPAEGAYCVGDGDCATDQTGLRCLTGTGGNTCQPVTCFQPVGWLAGGGGEPG